MRIVCISDLHLGDPRCGIVKRDPASGEFVLSDKYIKLRDACLAGVQISDTATAANDYLVLLGDIFDFAIQHYETAYNAAKVFFAAIVKDKLAADIIYLAGNHDRDMWHLLQYEICIVKRIRKCLPPQPLRHSVAAIIDERPNSKTKDLWLISAHDELIDVVYEKSRENRDGIFLDRLFFSSPINDDFKPTFNQDRPRFFVANPNFYLVTKNGDCILFTHGDYFQITWAIEGELAIALTQDDLNNASIVKTPTNVVCDPQYGLFAPLDSMMAMNFSINQFMCSGVGQAGPLTYIFQTVQQEIENAKSTKDLKRVRKYYKRLPGVLIDILNFGLIAAIILKILFKFTKNWFLKKIAKIENPKTINNFLAQKDVQKRIGKFFLSSIQQLNHINSLPLYCDNKIPIPNTLVFGHTHAPIPWSNPTLLANHITGSELKCVNSGGWLLHGDKVNAEVFIYNNGQISSQFIE
ncbi:MAG: metallophosphoesterase [Deltaproteobacteria bacterium]|nr:metallophosphoesterase [Deltaproteobacteria bacterium]